MNLSTDKTTLRIQPRRYPRPLARWFCKTSLCCLAVALLSGNLARSDEQADLKVEEFLTRLGLVELRTLHLEETLEFAIPASQRVTTAKRLADLYAGQLVTYSSNKARYDDVVQRINRLVTNVPEAQTPSLSVMLLQADFYRAENLMGQWTVDRRATEPRDEGHAILTRITPQLMNSYRQLKKDSDKLLDAIDALDEGDEQAAKEQQFRQLQSVAGRAGYFAGWSSYYLGLARQSKGAQTTEYAASRDMFRTLLGVTAEYAEEELEFLGLQSIRRAQALIGLGLAEAGAGNLDSSQKCFEWLESGGAPPNVRDEGPYWRLQALLNADRLDLALKFARKQVAALTQSATSGRVNFCVSLVRAAYASAPTPTPDLHELGMLGIAGLVKLRQHGPVRALLKEYKIELTDSTGFYLNWIKGQQLTEEAEKSKSKELFKQAIVALERAIEADDAKQDLGSLGQCQTHLATCYYRLNRFEDSARMFESAAAARKASGDTKAVDAAWAAFVSYQKLVSKQPRFVTATIDVLQQLQRDYPNHEYAQQANYHISKLRRNATSPAENLASLEKLPRDNPNYLASRYDICIIRYGLWKRSEAGKERHESGATVLAAVNLFLQAADDTDGKASQKVKVSSLAASVALDRKPSDVGLAETYLTRAAGWSGRLPNSSNVAAEYHYHMMRLAEATKNDTARASHAKWLAENGQGSAFELSGLVAAASAADVAAKRAGNSARNPDVREAHRIYARLSVLFGDSTAALTKQKNARVAMSKAAQYAAQLGDHREAALRLDKLLVALSGEKNKSYLRRAGLAHYAAGQYDQAIQHWRTLLAGLKKGSQDWYEAKYHQLACLAKMDPAKFKSVLAQFNFLYPKVPQPWQGKIAALSP